MASDTITYYGPAPTSADGVLNAFVQQPVANTPAEDANGKRTYKERWKGPYSRGKEILSTIANGDSIIAVYGWLGGNKVQRYDYPTATVIVSEIAPDGTVKKTIKRGTWCVETIDVIELDAGAHCYIDIQYTSEEISESSVDTLTEDETKRTWTVNWQSYSVTPYEFCSGTIHPDIPLSPSGQGYSHNWSLPASRTLIEAYKSHNPQLIKIQGEDVCIYTPNPNTPDCRLTLSPAEMCVIKKINSNRNATYHYPIVTYRQVFNGPRGASFTENLGSSLDKLTSLPEDCPYSFASLVNGDWQWLQVADDITQTKTDTTVTYERRQMWAGYTDVDENYYGIKPFTHSADGIKEGRWYKNCL